MAGAEAGVFVAELVDYAAGHRGVQEGGRPGFLFYFEAHRVVVVLLAISSFVLSRHGYLEPISIDVLAARHSATSQSVSHCFPANAFGPELFLDFGFLFVGKGDEA